MNRVLAAVVAVALLSEGALLAQGYGGVGFPGGGGKGLGALATAFCSLTGCTMTGQIVSSGVTCDFSTPSGEDWSVCPAGSGQIDLQAPIKNSAGTTIDIREAITNGGTALCSGLAATEGEVCVTPATGEGFMVSPATGSAYVRVWSASAGSAFIQLIPNGAANQAHITTYTTGVAAAMRIGSAGTDATVDDDIEDTNYRLAYAGPIRDIDDNNTAAASELYGLITDAATSSSAIGRRRLLVKGGGLVALGVEPQAVTCNDSGGAGPGSVSIDPTSSTVILTNNDAVGGCGVTVTDTTVSGTVNALGARVTICSSPQSQATLATFADNANNFRGGASQATGLLPGDCFDMVYIDATDDLWLATGPVSIN